MSQDDRRSPLSKISEPRLRRLYPSSEVSEPRLRRLYTDFAGFRPSVAIRSP
jgi:hypothetical protein